MRPGTAGSAGSRLYDDAAIYDILYAPGTADEVSGLVRLARREVRGRRQPHTWLEPACGTGRYLRYATRRGIRGVGFDRRPELVEYARRHSPRTRFFVADMVDFASRLGKVRADFAFNLHNTIRHLPSDRAVLDHLAEIARVLRPGGVYTVGISLAEEQEFEEDLWEGARGRIQVRQLVQYLPPQATGMRRRERVVSHLVVETPAGQEHRDAVYDLRCYDKRQWARLVARSAMRVVGHADAWGRALTQRTFPYAIDVLGRAEDL